MCSGVVIPWRQVEPVPQANGDTANLLATVDTVRSAWEEHLYRVSREEFEETRKRTLRRHAVETGIIERLYDLSWGITEAWLRRESPEMSQFAKATSPKTPSLLSTRNSTRSRCWSMPCEMDAS